MSQYRLPCCCNPVTVWEDDFDDAVVSHCYYFGHHNGTAWTYRRAGSSDTTASSRYAPRSVTVNGFQRRENIYRKVRRSFQVPFEFQLEAELNSAAASGTWAFDLSSMFGSVRLANTGTLTINDFGTAKSKSSTFPPGTTSHQIALVYRYWPATHEMQTVSVSYNGSSIVPTSGTNDIGNKRVITDSPRTYIEQQTYTTTLISILQNPPLEIDYWRIEMHKLP